MIGRAAALAAGLVAVAAIFVVARQPVTGPWWLNADPDAAYTASALNLLRGGHTRFFSHPGLPEQEALALSFGAQHVLQRLDGGPRSKQQFVDERLSDLDRTRSTFRGWAIALFVGGALVVFGLTARLLGLWWGVLAGVLFVAAPDFPSGSIQIRPDVALSVLSFAVIYLAARGAERRDATAYLAAGALFGFALTVKLHAIGLAPALLLAVVLRPPRVAARIRIPIAAVAAWLALVVVLNWNRVPFSPTAQEWRVVLIPVAVVAVWLAMSRRWPVLRPFLAQLAAAVLLGIAVPLSLFLPEGFRAAAAMWSGLTGGEAQQGVPLFTFDFGQLAHFPLRQGVVLLALAGAAAVVGVWRRSATPVLFFVAAIVMGVMAAARLGALRYFEPAYVLSIAPALWLFSRAPRILAPVAALVVTAYIALPTLHDVRAPAIQAASDERYAADASRVASRLLAPTDVALAPDYAPIADVRYWAVVQNFVEYTPPHTYTFLPDYAPALATAQAQASSVRFYFGPAVVDLAQPTTITLASGTWNATPVPEAATPEFGVARITPG